MPTICTLNCNSLRAAVKRGLLGWLSERQPDVLALQETRSPEDLALRVLRHDAGYHAAIRVGARPGYAGVALATRRPATFRPLDLGISSIDEEGRILRGDVGDAVVLSIYVPSGASRLPQKLAFLEALLDAATSIRDEGLPVLLCGDFNIAHTELDRVPPKRPGRRVVGFLPEERGILDHLATLGFVDVVRRAHRNQPGPYTWHPAGKPEFGWRLDHVWATDPVAARARRAWVDVAGLSDHRALWVELAEEHPMPGSHASDDRSAGR